MQCPNCGAEIGDSRFCQYCGSQITAEMRKEQEQLNKQGCPKCGSTNVRFNRENQGEVRGKNSKRVIHKTVGVCKDCGYTWYVGSNEQSGGRKTWLWVLGWLIIFPVPLTILMLRKKDMKPALKYGIIAAGWIIYLLIGFNSNSTKDKTKESNKQVVEQSSEAVSDKSEEITEESKDILSSTEAPSEIIEEKASVPDEIKVSVDVSAIKDGSDTKFSINTNLPDETVLMLSLSRGDYNSDEDVFMAQSKVTVKDGKAESEGFSEKGERLSGDYDLSVSMSLPSLQSDDVRAVIGENGEYMTGALVEKDSISNKQNVVSAMYVVSVGDENVDVQPEAEYQYTKFKDDDGADIEASKMDEDDALLLYKTALELTLKDKFGNDYEVEQDGKFIHVNVWKEGVAMGAASTVKGVADLSGEWEYMKKGVQSFAKSLYSSLGEYGLDDYHVSVNVLNDTNKDNVLLSYVDGVLISDAIRDYKE